MITEDMIAGLYPDFTVGRTSSGLSYVDIADEYVAWLTNINAGMLSRGNLLCFDYALRNLPSANAIVEIGVFAGLSTNLISHYRRLHRVQAPFLNCDRWLFEGASGRVGQSQISHAQYRDFVKHTYQNNVRMFSGDQLPHTMELFSDDFFAAWERGERKTDLWGRVVQMGGPISFCYVDGNHTYEYARRDFTNVDRYLEVGGFVLFDDSADGTKFEVGRVIDEVKKLDGYQLIIKNPNYLFQKVG